MAIKIKELRDKSVTELQQQLKELQEEFYNLRSKRTTGQLEKPHRFSEVRKTIARIKTLIRSEDATNKKAEKD